MAASERSKLNAARVIGLRPSTQGRWQHDRALTEVGLRVPLAAIADAGAELREAGARVDQRAG